MIRQLHVAALAFSFFCFLQQALAQQASFQPGPVFPAGAKLESAFSGGFFLEGPAVTSDGTVYFSDIAITAQTGGRLRLPMPCPYGHDHR